MLRIGGENTFLQLKKNIKISLHYLKLCSNIDHIYIPLAIFSAVLSAIITPINTILFKLIIDSLIFHKIKESAILIVVVLLNNLFVRNIVSFTNYYVNIKEKKIISELKALLGQKIMTMDYSHIENPKIISEKEKAIYPVMNQNALHVMLNDISSIIKLSIMITILFTIIITLHPLILIFIIIIIFIDALFLKKTQASELEFFNELIKDNRKMNYYMGLIKDFSIAKEIRIHSIDELILAKIKKYVEHSTAKFIKLSSSIGKNIGKACMFAQIILFFIYMYIVFQMSIHKISVGSFTMYVSAINEFNMAINELIKCILEYKQMCNLLIPYISFETIITNKSKKRTATYPLHSQKMVIEFKNVYFKYPYKCTYVLKNVNIIFNFNEKISIVGLNGAGKTTFIKLLCGLYKPTSGQILVNGQPIDSYDYYNYLQNFAVLFQDFKIFAWSIAENIALARDLDPKRILQGLKQVGLEDKVNSIKFGIKTPIYKIFNKDGIEFSGGELQKIAISRTLYNTKSKFIILDEPTANLDPISESTIYKMVNNMVQHKTIIYITHRLSSCKFCDRVLVFDGGSIIQDGNHKDLIKDTTGCYYKLFYKQTQSYNS